MNLTKKVLDFGSKHTPEILTGFGVAGMLTTTFLAVKATPKALEIIEEEKRVEKVDKLPLKKTVKATWKLYLPSITLATVSTICLIGSSSVSAKRNAALATAYKIAETARREYREKVIETIGEEKEKIITDKVAKDKIAKNPVKNTEVIVTNRGNTLCYDSISGRYFRTDIDKIKRIENELNHRIIQECYISLNDFYTVLGLECTYPIGEDLGWNIDQGLIEFTYSSQLTEYDEPCLVLSYNIAPKYDYYKMV